jgi:2,5-dioxopentanoate dehydrogenase
MFNMTISGKNHIGNKLSAEGSLTFKTFNPLENRENSISYHEATDSEIDEACLLAKNAFHTYKNTSSATRASFLDLIAEKLELNREILETQFCNESGLPSNRATQELNRTIFQLNTFSKALKSDNWGFISREVSQHDPFKSFEKKYIPLGPVAVFGASNFPFAYSTIGGDSASALAVGCPVIVKSHPFHAGLSELVAQIVLEAIHEMDLPNGTFSHLHGKSYSVSEKIVKNPFIQAVGFTGSFQGGTALMSYVNQRSIPIPIYAEMGSLNPIFILENCFLSNKEKIIQLVADSITLNSGQFCTNPGLIFVPKDISKEFEFLISKKLSEYENQCMLHPTIHQTFEKKVQELQQDEKIETLYQQKSEIPNFGTIVIHKTNFKTFLENNHFQEEIFGSHSLLVEIEDDHHFLEILSHLNGQLTASVFCDENDKNYYSSFLNELPYLAGRIIFNGVPTGVEVCDSMHHGGSFPATSDSKYTAVGKDAMFRFVRPVSLQTHSI